MKTLTCLISAGVASALLAVAAQAEKVAYLGVATTPVDPVTAAQLDLPEGEGLTVIQVAEDGVVKDKLAVYDILSKLDDQILTYPEQLAVLVRSHKPGDKVKLAILHKGKAEVVKVQLGETDAQRFTPRGHRHGWPMMQPYGLPPASGEGNLAPYRDDENATSPTPRGQDQTQSGPRTNTSQKSHSTSIITDSHNGLTVTITDHDGEKTVKAEENDRIIVDNQPITTDDQLKALPEKVRTRVHDILKHYKIEITPQSQPRGQGPNIAL